jgi:hypothetical protein
MKRIYKDNVDFPKLCVLCKKVRLKRGRATYCGSYLQKIGCSYIRHKQRVNEGWKKWKVRYPDRYSEHQKVQSAKKKSKKIRTKYIKGRGG